MQDHYDQREALHKAGITGSVSPQMIDSTSDQRTANNVMRHQYRVLTPAEKALMQQLKDDGLAFWNLLDALGSSREVSLAKTKIEEAVMWGVKHITG